MRSRLSIFSSRLFGSALIWAVLAAVLIEWRAQQALPATHSNHEVDTMLTYLDQGQFPEGDTVFLGDSVGRQICNAILKMNPDTFVPLASNAAIETPGQYYMFRRYLERYPAPRRLILMMGNPMKGQLRGNYTENYIQRTFLHWQEIAELSWARRSLSFGLVMVGYKLFPTFRYRLSLQKNIHHSDEFDFTDNTARIKDTAKHGLLDLMDEWFKQHRTGPSIAEVYFHRLALLLESLEIEWVYMPIPLPESKSHKADPGGYYGSQVAQVLTLSKEFPLLRVLDHFWLYPDAWFRDGTHLYNKDLPLVAKDINQSLQLIGFP